MDWNLAILAIILLVVGLVGQGFEMRKIKQSLDDVSSQNVFLDKRNYKWYGVIGIGIISWYAAEQL